MRTLSIVLLVRVVGLTDAPLSKGGSSEGPPIDSRGSQVAEVASGPVSTCVSWVRRADGPTRSAHAAVWDSVRNQIVIYGGASFGYECFEGDTWTWDGMTWTMLAVLSTSIPAASSWGLAVMIVGTIAAGMAVLRRRAGLTAAP